MLELVPISLKEANEFVKWMEMCRGSWRRKMDWKEAAKGGFIPSTDEIEV